MSLLLPPIQPEEAAVAEVEDCERTASTQTDWPLTEARSDRGGRRIVPGAHPLSNWTFAGSKSLTQFSNTSIHATLFL